MAIPSGSGSEVLWKGVIHAQDNDTTALRWDRTNPAQGIETYVVPALHIITLLSMTFTEMGNRSDQTIEVQNVISGGASAIYLLKLQPLGAYETFVWNDKIVLTPGEKINIIGVASGNMDVTYSFIDQNWED
jgi:hypothetical protein